MVLIVAMVVVVYLLGLWRLLTIFASVMDSMATHLQGLVQGFSV